MFLVTMECSIAIEESVFPAVLTDEWRRVFYPLRTPDEVAEHLAFNLVQGHPIEHLDGFADQAGDAAIVGDLQVTDVTELKKGGLHE